MFDKFFDNIIKIKIIILIFFIIIALIFSIVYCFFFENQLFNEWLLAFSDLIYYVLKFIWDETTFGYKCNYIYSHIIYFKDLFIEVFVDYFFIEEDEPLTKTEKEACKENKEASEILHYEKIKRKRKEKEQKSMERILEFRQSLDEQTQKFYRAYKNRR